jgi:hypothetical protein
MCPAYQKLPGPVHRAPTPIPRGFAGRRSKIIKKIKIHQLLATRSSRGRIRPKNIKKIKK